MTDANKFEFDNTMKQTMEKMLLHQNIYKYLFYKINFKFYLIGPWILKLILVENQYPCLKN